MDGEESDPRVWESQERRVFVNKVLSVTVSIGSGVTGSIKEKRGPSD